MDSFVKQRSYLLGIIPELTRQLEEMKHPCPGMSPHDLKRLNLYASTPDFRAYVDEWIEVKSKLEAYTVELDSISSYIVRCSNPNFQSYDGYQKDGIIDPSTVVHHENVTEIGGDETLIVPSIPNTISYIKADQDLDSFFMRPIQIGSFAMSTGGTYDNTYKIADLYLMDPAVRAKIRNFAFMRGTFVVRISVSGTPFDYGRILASAYPWASRNLPLQTLYNISATWDLLKLQYLSQSKTATIIDVKENRPVDIELPFISPMPVGRLFNVSSTSAIPSGTSLDDWTNMWTLYIKTLNSLSSVSASPSPVYVYVYAYMKDVQIGIPTATQMVITTQSDERVVGPVERISSNLLSISKRLEMAPYIGLYAKASSFVLSGISGVASLFGWSAPVMITKPNRVKPEPYQNGTNLIQNDTGQRITLDPKQELAISLEYLAVDKDELVISDLCKRQSFLQTFTWSASTTPLTSIIQIPIHPRLNSPYISSPSGTYNIVPTPMNMVSHLFSKWHGKVVITLEAVCSNFHRGKLGITYEPNVAQLTLITANTNLNKQYTHIWDIQETQRYSICVDWNFCRPWADNITNAEARNCVPGVGLNVDQAAYNGWNGFLNIFPITKLQSPDGSSIPMNIYVHGEDMQFNRLSQLYIPTSRSVSYNSSESPTDEKVSSNLDASCIEINPSSVSTVGLDSHFYGESPISLRSIFKRFVWTNEAYASLSASSAQSSFAVTFPIHTPVLPSFTTNAPTNINALSYFQWAFLGMRGGIRKRINLGYYGNMFPVTLTVDLLDDSVTTPSPVMTIDSSVINSTSAMKLGGSAKFVPATNGGVEFEIPFYSNNYFVWACSADPYDNSDSPMDNNNLRGYRVASYIPPQSGSTIPTITEESATAEDFQLGYFLGGVPYVG